MDHAFSGYHPAVNFLYFLMVLTGAMTLLHPACLVISLLCAASCGIGFFGLRAMVRRAALALPLVLCAALINPAFNHEGATILTYFPGGNPLTLESLAYGLAAACLLVSVLLWFAVFQQVMTSDKLICLFGRIIPALSLIFTMTLRFIPQFQAQLKVLSQAQRCIGRDSSNGSLPQKIRHGFKILSIMITWSLENAIETADSMKSRGYGLPGRSSFSIFRFDRRDRLLLLLLLCLGAYLGIGVLRGGLYWRYFPSMRGVAAGGYPVSLLAVYFFLCSIPMILEIREAFRWKHSASQI